MAAEALGVERGAHGVGVQMQFRRNGADFPVLGELSGRVRKIVWANLIQG
jgi:hypothetical protein